jgi:type 1 glutamine amidotransferase
MKHLARLLFCLVALAAALHAADSRKKLVMLIAEPEYDTAKTLPEFAAKHLEKDFRVVIVSGNPGANETSFDRIDEINDADVLLVSVRRRTPPKAQLEVIRRYVAAGKPVVGIRTASHAFALGKGQKLADGNADWPQWDEQVIGGNYANHHGKGPAIAVAAADAAHPILRGVKVPFTSESTLYRNSPLRAGAHALLSGTIPNQPTEPLAWTFKRADGGKTFYTSLGSPSDFQNPSFTALLKNGIRWAAVK